MGTSGFKNKTLSKQEKEVINEQINKSVCKIYIGNYEKGYGFLCIYQNYYLLLVNNEYLRNETINSQKKVELKLNDNSSILIEIKKSKEYQQFGMIIFIIEIKNDIYLNKIKFLEIDKDLYTLNSNLRNKFIYILNDLSLINPDYTIGKIKSIDESI